MGLLILIIAGTGEGKTTKVKSIINGRRCLVYDVNGEYQDLPTDANKERSRFFSDNVNDFLNIVSRKNKGTICVFEEATGFFAGGTSKTTKKIIVAKRHPISEGGRNLIFVFHTINSIPPFLIDTADVIILGKTGDEPNRVKVKSSKLYPIFLHVRNQRKYYFYNLKNK